LKQLKKSLKIKRRERKWIREEISAANELAKIIEYRRKRKRIEQVIFQLKRELSVVEKGRAVGEPGTGALPDFVIIGAMKAGTTFLYNLLTLHPHVEPAASKELDYFDNLIEEEDVEWYRQCFPQPRWEDSRRTITGEATPYYLFYPHAAKRMAEVVPEARVIALLRDPVDRAYSHYQHVVRKGWETRTFEEVIDAEEVTLRGERGKMLEDEYYPGADHQFFWYLSRSIYVDQLLRWSRFFGDEQMLVLKSENLFERPQDTLQIILDFLKLPDWEPEAWEKIPKKPNKGKSYGQRMDPATRQRLEGFFEPHNRRLYEYLGMDFGW
jgi:hypothetical protein